MADLKFLITIPEEYAGRPAAAISANYKRPDTIFVIQGEGDEAQSVEISNPVSKVQFAAGILMKFVKDNMKAYEVPDLAKADRQAKIDEIDAITITIQVVP